MVCGESPGEVCAAEGVRVGGVGVSGGVVALGRRGGGGAGETKRTQHNCDPPTAAHARTHARTHANLTHFC